MHGGQEENMPQGKKYTFQNLCSINKYEQKYLNVTATLYYEKQGVKKYNIHHVFIRNLPTIPPTSNNVDKSPETSAS